MYPDMFQILFNTYGYDDTIRGTDNFRWLMAYQQGEGSMVGHMEPAVENFKRLVDDGILSTADWNVAPRTRSTMLYGEHSTAMIIECQNAVSYARTLAGTGEIHELGMMPFWTSDEEDSDYLYTIPSYYIGISRRAAQESKSKKALLLEIVQYISSEEGQKELLSGGLQMSNIKGVSMEKNDFIAEVSDTIDKGNVIATFYYAAGEDNKQVERQMLQTASDMLDGTISVEEWLQGADQARDVFLAGDSEQEEVFGQAKTTLTKLESAYTVAQMYQSVTGAQIGICYGGVYRYGTNGYFYEGDITEDSLACITPDKEADADASDPMNGKVVVAKLTGAQILNILNSVGTETDVNGQYPYYVAYGLTVRFNPWAAEGSRVLSCKLPDGEELDPDETYEVAYFYGSVSDSAIKPERALSQTWQELFVSWLEKQGGVLEEPEMTLELVYDDAQEE
jgi:raffinose/stachyose/melibiose transport system substrate-binding protein